MINVKNVIQGISLSFLTWGVLEAEVKMPSFFSDGMVIQRQTEAMLWGWAEPGVEAKVSFMGKVESSTTSASGRWKVSFKGLEALSTGSDLIVEVGDDKKVIHDVLVGEVWLAAGQSNMAWEMRQSTSRDLAKSVDLPLVRHFKGKNVSSDQEEADYSGSWLPANPKNAPKFSAVGFHFAENLHRELKVPIGMIELAWGGMPIQSFISDTSLRKIPEAHKDLRREEMLAQKYSPERAKREYDERMTKFLADIKKWEAKKQGKKPRRPVLELDPKRIPSNPSNIFQGMVHSFVGYGIRGAIWYQGEKNASQGKLYGTYLEGLVEDWRNLWGYDFSFYWAQLANYKKSRGQPGQEGGWIYLQNEQRLALKKISKSGMAVTNDIGGIGIHPGNKKDVGLRLSRWALHQDFGLNLIPSGPLYRSTVFEGPQAIVSFDYAEGLRSRDGKALKHFECAGKNGKWVWADARIEGKQVVVTAPSIEEAKMVRYAWAMNPEGANLVNEVGLPTSCFRSEKSEK
jgi:sialate O-acetylesterase